MGARISDRTIAGRALTKLKERKEGFGGFMKTSDLFATSGFNFSEDQVDHSYFRDIMNQLWRAGVVTRSGGRMGSSGRKGSFLWKLHDDVDSWDEYNPFKRLPSAPSAQDIRDQTSRYTSGHTSATPSWNRPKPEPVVQQHLNGDYVKQTEFASAFGTLVDVGSSLRKLIDEKEEQIGALRKEVEEWRHQATAHIKVLEIRQFNKTKVKLKNVVLPKVYERVLQLAQCRRNILLVGPAGCGKTYLGGLIARSLKLEFGTMSCTAGMSEAHLLGRVAPNLTTGKNVFQGSDFLDKYEKGGVYLLDELDAADSNMMLCLNTALANGYANVPNRRDRPRAEQHEDFVCIGTANTFGKGANRMYSGRNQLDEATLDRFRIGIVECDYDSSVELAVCPDQDLRETLQKIREKINGCPGMRRIMSTRFLADAYVMVSQGGWDKQGVLDAYFEGWTDEEKAKVAW